MDQKQKTALVGDWGTETKSSSPLPTVKKPESKPVKKKNPIIEEMAERRKKKKESRSRCGCF